MLYLSVVTINTTLKFFNIYRGSSPMLWQLGNSTYTFMVLAWSYKLTFTTPWFTNSITYGFVLSSKFLVTDGKIKDWSLTFLLKVFNVSFYPVLVLQTMLSSVDTFSLHISQFSQDPMVTRLLI